MHTFTDEYDYLIHLIKCTLRDEQPMELPESLSFDTVYQHAMKHDVANITFYSIEKLVCPPKSPLYEQWEMRRDMAITRDVNQTFARQEIVDEFQKADIPFLEIQGTKMKELYPRRDYRTMSDLDFIVKPCHLEQAKTILGQLEYECTHIDDVEVDAKRAPTLFVEMHTEFFPKDCEYHSCLGEDPFVYTTDETSVSNEELLYVYTILHVAKHYFLSGCGVRRVMDIYILQHCYPDMFERPFVQQVVASAGITRFTCCLFSLAEWWFGNGEADETVIRMGKTILQTGVHGSQDEWVRNRLREQKSGRFSRIRFICQRLFPSKDMLKNRYPILEKHGYLLLFCWLHRVIVSLFSRRVRAEFATACTADIPKRID